MAGRASWSRKGTAERVSDCPNWACCWKNAARRWRPVRSSRPRCWAASIIDRYGNEGQKGELLPAIAAGGAVVTPAIHEKAPGWASNRVETTARVEGGQWVLRGEKRFVPFADAADIFLVSANTGSGDDDCTLFVVRREDVANSEIVPMKTASGSPVGQLKLRGITLPEDAVLGEVGNGIEAADHLLHLGAVGRSLQMAGAARRVVDVTVDYVSNRKQFGRPVGSFQAVQHHCANMALAARGILLMARRGAWALSQGSSRCERRAQGEAVRQPRASRHLRFGAPVPRRDRLHLGARHAPVHAAHPRVAVAVR